MILICLNCNNTFNSKRKDRRFCCDQCKKQFAYKYKSDVFIARIWKGNLEQKKSKIQHLPYLRKYGWERLDFLFEGYKNIEAKILLNNICDEYDSFDRYDHIKDFVNEYKEKLNV